MIAEMLYFCITGLRAFHASPFPPVDTLVRVVDVPRSPKPHLGSVFEGIGSLEFSLPEATEEVAPAEGEVLSKNSEARKRYWLSEKVYSVIVNARGKKANASFHREAETLLGSQRRLKTCKPQLP